MVYVQENALFSLEMNAYAWINEQFVFVNEQFFLLITVVSVRPFLHGIKL